MKIHVHFLCQTSITPLSAAAGGGVQELVDILLCNGADIEGRNKVCLQVQPYEWHHRLYIIP